jgi:hypothetical protein
MNLQEQRLVQCPIESAITLVHQTEQLQGGNGKRKRFTATKVATSFPSHRL